MAYLIAILFGAAFGVTTALTVRMGTCAATWSVRVTGKILFIAAFAAVIVAFPDPPYD